MIPEIIEGLGDYKAGLGSIVTDWFPTKEQAIAEFYRLANQPDDDA